MLRAERKTPFCYRYKDKNIYLINPTLFTYQVNAMGITCTLDTVEWMDGVHIATFSLAPTLG